MIYNSLTVNYTSSVAFNSPSFLSVAHLFYRTPRFLYLCVFGYYFPLACITFKLKRTSLLEKFWMCLSEDIGGWQIFGEALFIEKYIEKYLWIWKMLCDMQNLSVKNARFRAEFLLQSEKKPMWDQELAYLPVACGRPRFKSLQEFEPGLSAFRWVPWQWGRVRPCVAGF